MDDSPHLLRVPLRVVRSLREDGPARTSSTLTGVQARLHRQRLQAKTQEVQAELARQTELYGSMVRVCIHCGALTGGMPLSLLRAGWTALNRAEWLCPDCKGILP
jgi:hypothetical protein